MSSDDWQTFQNTDKYMKISRKMVAILNIVKFKRL